MTDNEMLEQLFRPMKDLKLPDEGFSARVMQQLPQRSRWSALSSRVFLSRLWTAFCVAIAVALFVLLRGWELMAYGLLMIVNNLAVVRNSLLVAAVVAVVLGLMYVSDVVRRERYSVL
jgi:hypothetical protein